MTPSGVTVRADASDLVALRALCVAMIREDRTDDALDLVMELLGQLRDHNDALQVRAAERAPPALRAALGEALGGAAQGSSRTHRNPTRLSRASGETQSRLPARTPERLR